MTVLTGRIEKNKSDLHCKAIGRNFDCRCTFLQFMYKNTAFNMALLLRKALCNFSLLWISFRLTACIHNSCPWNVIRVHQLSLWCDAISSFLWSGKCQSILIPYHAAHVERSPESIMATGGSLRGHKGDGKHLDDSDNNPGNFQALLQSQCTWCWWHCSSWTFNNRESHCS